MENIESLQAQLSLAGEIAVSHKNNILTDRIFLQISGRKQISAQPAQWTQNGYQKDIHLWTSQCSEDFEWQHLPLLITFKTH